MTEELQEVESVMVTFKDGTHTWIPLIDLVRQIMNVPIFEAKELPKLTWRTKDPMTHDRIIASSFEEALRYYEGWNPPVLRIDGIEEPYLESVERMKNFKRRDSGGVESVA